MKATIRDADAIGALRPLNVVGYLRAHGWRKFSESAGKFSVWVHPSHPEAEIVVPLNRAAGDFVLQLADNLRELEAVEGRSQFDILRDLLNYGALAPIAMIGAVMSTIVVAVFIAILVAGAMIWADELIQHWRNGPDIHDDYSTWE